MPEGHTIHRLARLHRKRFAGSPVRVSSPQGRFAHGAARLDGRVLDTVEAHGKHLFYRFAGVAESLHVHLGLVGVFRTRGSEQTAGPAVRLRLAADTGAVDLSGPMVCELIDPGTESALRGELGPDPLRRGDDPERMWEAVQRRRMGIGAALLDQRVVAGIGNVFRAEGLFLTGIHPDRPANDLTRSEFDALWRDLREQLRAGERSGRIVTVDPADVGAPSRAQVPDDERVYVYRRTGLPCRRCGTAVVSWRLAGRTVSACPACQPA